MTPPPAKGARRLTRLALLTAIALTIFLVEAQLPPLTPVPGIKLGLPNLLVVLCLYLYGWKEALGMNLVRVLLSSFLFGNLYGLLYSLCGALLSFAAMGLSKRFGRFSMVGVSVWGGVAHNVGQLLAAIFVVQTPQVAYYLPWLTAAGCLAGVFNGVCARSVLIHLPSGRGTGREF